MPASAPTSAVVYNVGNVFSCLGENIATIVIFTLSRLSAGMTSSESKPLSFAFSGCGWLIPFYLGAIEELKSQNELLTEQSIIAGTSGGALAALIACSNVDTNKALNVLIRLSQEERFIKNVDQGLKECLLPLLPDDVLARCNGRLHVTITKIWPNPKLEAHIVSQFLSVDHLMSVVAASCFIPLYSAPFKLVTNIKTQNIGYYVDGGVLAHMPPIGDVQISPLQRRLLRVGSNSNNHPDISLPSNSPYSMRQLLVWVLFPAPEVHLRELYHLGRQAAKTWIEDYEQGKITLQKDRIVTKSSSLRGRIKAPVDINFSFEVWKAKLKIPTLNTKKMELYKRRSHEVSNRLVKIVKKLWR